MAKRLVKAGVNMVQVNLGNNETWILMEMRFTDLRKNSFHQRIEHFVH